MPWRGWACLGHPWNLVGECEGAAGFLTSPRRAAEMVVGLGQGEGLDTHQPVLGTGLSVWVIYRSK